MAGYEIRFDLLQSDKGIIDANIQVLNTLNALKAENIKKKSEIVFVWCEINCLIKNGTIEIHFIGHGFHYFGANL